MTGPDESLFDWNLVRNLHALLLDRSVTRAAARVGITQSAMSRVLQRLRVVFDDELFVRTSWGMEPTARALELAPLVERLCEQMGAIARGSRFDPKTAEKTFHIVSADYTEWLVMPLLMAKMQERAPGCSVVFRRAATDGQEYLDDAQTDLLIGPRLPRRASMKSQQLMNEDFRCIVSRSHPRLGARKSLSLTAFCAEGHVLVAPSGRPGGVVDQELARAGYARRVVARVPTFLVAPEVVARTELVATIPTRLAESNAERLGLRVLAPPLKVPGFSLRQMWHPSKDGDEAHVFLRTLVREIALGIAA